MKRLKPDQIKPGCSYRLMPFYVPMPGKKIIRRVDAIENGDVVVHVNGKEVRLPVRDFANLAVEEVNDVTY